MRVRSLAMMVLAAAVPLLVVSCKRKRPAPVVITKAIGTEPFWGLEVRTDRLLLTRPGTDSVVYPYTPATVDSTGRAIFRAKRYATDEALVLVVQPGDCSDGMSDTRYPALAALSRGDSTWQGCATKVLTP